MYHEVVEAVITIIITVVVIISTTIRIMITIIVIIIVSVIRNKIGGRRHSQNAFVCIFILFIMFIERIDYKTKKVV